MLNLVRAEAIVDYLLVNGVSCDWFKRGGKELFDLVTENDGRGRGRMTENEVDIAV